MFFCQWHRHTRIQKVTSTPNKCWTYYLPITSSNALPLSYRRLVVARPLNEVNVTRKVQIDRHFISLLCLWFNYFNILVDGGWSSWGAWKSCSVTCGGGLRERVRTCTNPRPRWDGRSCQGHSFMSQPCNANPCPSKINNCSTVWQIHLPAVLRAIVFTGF